MSRRYLQALNPNGTLDTTFGSGGLGTVRLVASGASEGGLAAQTDGKILASIMGVFVTRGNATRPNPNGSMDSTFGMSGIASIPSLAPTGPVLLQLG